MKGLRPINLLWVAPEIILGVLLSPLLARLVVAFDKEAYLDGREVLLKEEALLMLGHDQILTLEEQVVNNILMAFKKAEMDKAFEDLQFLPAKNFLVAKDEIEKSEVFKIIRLMPKGADLHNHASAAVSTEWIISELTYWENLYMCITSENKLHMKFMESPSSSCDWKLVSEVRSSYSSPEKLDDELMKRMTLVTDNPGEEYSDINNVWSAFMDCFTATNGVTKYRPALEVYLRRIFQEFIQDNVQYLELRSSLGAFYELNGTLLTKEEGLAMHETISQQFRNEHPDDFFGSRVIYSTHRSRNLGDIWQSVSIARLLKKKHPEYLAGFDLVGQEDLGFTLKQLLDPLLTLSSREPNIPVFYHGGETNWLGMETDENLIDALLLNASRIGHGFAVNKHPIVKRLIRERDIPLEICPISNQVLMLVSDLRNHPAVEMATEGYPIVIASDGPAIFGAQGLSYDFYEAFMAFGGAKADLRFLKQLAINSIKYSSLDSISKKDLMTMWQQKWNEFVYKVIRLYNNEL